MESDFLQKHKVFASNPMLLTFVVMKYPIVDSFDGKKRLFYRKVYDTIVSGHDEEKQGYSRVFRSAQGDREFTKVFREFCAVTYLKHEAEFDLDTFEVYFEGLTTRTTLENPKIMTSKNFIHDACATACMMYEEEVKSYISTRVSKNTCLHSIIFQLHLKRLKSSAKVCGMCHKQNSMRVTLLTCYMNSHRRSLIDIS